MRKSLSGLVTGAAAVLLLAAAPAAQALAASPADQQTDAKARAVFVQTNAPSGNVVLSYVRHADGTLGPAHAYATGGKGGTAKGAPVDALASQGSLVYDAGHQLLLAVNAGSDTLTVFHVSGATLVRSQVVTSGGEFPVSVAVHGSLVYVLGAGGKGAVSGFRIDGAHLVPIARSTRYLGLANTTPPVFIDAPAQVGFDPSGAHVVVTTKSHGTVDVFGVRADGRLTSSPVQNVSAGAVPFAFSFDAAGRLVVTEAAHSTVSTYRIRTDGTLRTLDGAAAANGQAALCWLVTARGFFYGANAGSASLSTYRVGVGGHVTLVAAVGASTGAGPIDSAVSGNGRYLYQQESAAGQVEGFRVGADGSLTKVALVTGLPVFSGHGMEGIAAT